MWIVQALAGTSLLVALGVVWLRWKIETDYKLEFEKHGDYGLSTGEDIVELKGVNFNGKVSIVTGANTGLGLETARVIGKNGGTVVMACRDPVRCIEAKALIKDEVVAGGGAVRCMELNLTSLASVDQFAVDFLESGLELDYLINNAGTGAVHKFQTTEDGYEKVWGVNHLGHFHLTTQLLEKLKRHKGRIVNIASLLHYQYTGNVSDIPLTEDSYKPALAYASSKLSNIIFTLGLRERLKGTGVLATSGHPGVILDTELVTGDRETVMKAISSLYRFVFGYTPIKTIPQGTSTTLCMMLDDLPETGTEKLYYADCVPGMVGDNYFDELTTDLKSADQLWKTSEKLVNQYLSNKNQ